MINFNTKPSYGFSDLVALVAVLRAPDGCPWDSVQTHESIRRNFIEEVYEACEAIDSGDPASLREELGDVLLHVVFHAGIEQDAGRFTIDDVCDTVVKKMISRHPALFGGAGAGLSWEELKRREKGQTALSGELDSVAKSLPALWRAEKIQKKAEAAGIAVPADLPPQSEVLRAEDRQASVGALLFSAVSLARTAGVDPEIALAQCCDAFIARVRREETSGGETQKSQADLSAQH